MYQNLSKELRQKNIAQAAVASSIGCTDRAFTNKLNGTSDFTVKESLKIRQGFLPEFTYEYLFESTAEDRPA